MTTLSSPCECAAWYTQASGNAAVVMSDPRADVRLDDVAGRTTMVDALTTLRWISAPDTKAAPRLLALSAGGEAALVLHRSVDALTGDVLLGPRLAQDPPLTRQLAALGLSSRPAPEAGPDFAVVTQDALASVLAFAVVAEHEAPGEDDQRPPTPAPEDIPLDIYDSRLIGLATRFGAPLEAVWHIMWELSGVRWCLLNADLDVEDVARIPYRQPLSAADFVSALRACTVAGLHLLELPVCVMTAPGQGHVVHIQHFEDDLAVYHDPWPGRSLLAAGNNALGMAAWPWHGPASRWCIGVADLQRVAYASLVQPAVWLPLCDVETEVRYAELSASDFFTFFRLSEIGRRTDPESGLVDIGLQPGRWREHIGLNLSVDPRDDVRRATLTITRSWLTAPDTAMFAVDLITHFIGALVPPADAEETRLLLNALRALPSGKLTEALASGPAHLLKPYRLIAMTMAGMAPFARATLPCSTVRVFNGTIQGDAEAQPQFFVSIARPRNEAGPLPEDEASGYFMDDYRSSLWQKARKEVARMRG